MRKEKRRRPRRVSEGSRNPNPNPNPNTNTNTNPDTNINIDIHRTADALFDIMDVSQSGAIPRAELLILHGGDGGGYLNHFEQGAC